MGVLSGSLPRMKRLARRRTMQQQDTWTAWLLVAPSIIIILGITLQPILSTLYLSFFQASSGLNATQTFIGFDNYLNILKEESFWATVARTLFFALTSVSVELILGIAIAQLIQARPFGWQFLRVSLIIPWAIPTIVNGSMWRWIYNADYGVLNAILKQSGLIEHYIPWLIDPIRAMLLVIVADVWHAVPFIALIMQAAMASLPAELDEAGAVDGANRWQRFWFIRLPLLRPAILVVLIIRSVEAFRVFDIVYVLTQGGPAFGTMTISYQTYLETFSYGNLGRGSALSFLVSIFTLIMAAVYLFYLYHPKEDG